MIFAVGLVGRVGSKEILSTKRTIKKRFAFAFDEGADQLCISSQLIGVFVFVLRLVLFLFFLDPKFQASSHRLWLQRPGCVIPGQKPRRPVCVAAQV